MRQKLRTAIETERLVLLPGENERDNASFLRMLKTDSDFQMFCGMEYSEKNLLGFDGYLEKEHFYAVYLKNDLNELLGYVGLAWHRSQKRYEVEFYIKRAARRKGYCAEALCALCKAAFAGTVVDDPTGLDAIYATTQNENKPARELLKKCNFSLAENGAIGILMFDTTADEVFGISISEYVLRKTQMEQLDQKEAVSCV